MAKIKTLFLDVGGVLLTNGWDKESRKKAAAHFGISFEEMESRHHLSFDTYEEGKQSLEEYLSKTVFYEPRSFSYKDFEQFMFAQSQPFPEMIHWIKELKKKYGWKIVVVSNEGLELTKYRIQTFGLSEFVDIFIASSFVRLRKPDQDIYRLALDISQSLPQEVVYIDDRLLFVEVARGLGIHSIHHTDVSTTKVYLERANRENRSLATDDVP